MYVALTKRIGKRVEMELTCSRNVHGRVVGIDLLSVTIRNEDIDWFVAMDKILMFRDFEG